MNQEYFHDTIAAISTGIGKAAIAIIRISGDKAIQIASQIFHKANFDFKTSNSHKLYFGKIIDPCSNKHIDEVLITFMCSDNSFTREDLVEIHCHGGEVVPYTILKLILTLGARMADPGEFTRRAFLNGRIDLTQAEAIHEIIESQNKLSSNIALANLEKRFSSVIYSFKDELIKMLAELEVNIDYPEEDLDAILYEKYITTLDKIGNMIDKIVSDSKNGRIIKHGIKVTITGKTNVGKSSLFNHLIRDDRAIVSHIHGTTRDFLETHISLSGIPVQLVDTAGFRKTEDEIEKIGKIKSTQIMQEADYILWMLDQSREWDNDDEDILSQIDKNKVITIINKMDLKKMLNTHEIYKKLSPIGIFNVSIYNKTGLEELEIGLREIFVGKDFTFNEQSIICNIRQQTLLDKVKNSIQKAIRAMSDNLSYEFIAIDLREALNFLGEIVGEVTTEDVLNEIFSNFCIGK
ncbi:MAG: tRNA uridine-5-carboxymethylaminomethyl(34) synthesis GTPase MnmE [Spirochaetota bacterium]|nr:tRNA uridine-5-carboxymethylaminomethyl(34) synthesis GTPase MnmE [Spirochaetota bacterium]